MIEIKYHQAGPHVSHGRENQGRGDLAAVSRDDLRWYYFLSDVSFKIDEADLTPPW
ncbi:hypothetical protein [Actinoplanes sp. CA-252034]|uniref:hypothetical protein n=1 Tax=Actinoplanes sp. CA-252034 TaxID=3239906 RepID=UPI003D97BC8D